MKKLLYFFVLLNYMRTIFGFYCQPHFPYYSQVGQDKFLHEKLFKNKRHGIFVDIGAHDGVSFSNTYYFEKELGWTGLCIEPHPDIFPELVKNRKAICLQLCAGKENTLIDFIKVNGAPEMLSGMLNTYDPRHAARLKLEIDLYGGSFEIVTIASKTLTSLFEENNLYEIDFISIDTEGSEKAIIESIDFSKFIIKCIMIENNYPDKFGEIKEILLKNGYTHYTCVDQDEVFILKDFFDL